MLNVKSFRQQSGRCGPAVLKMVFEYYGRKMAEIELAKLTKCDPAQGVAGEVLVSTAKKLGFKAELKNGATFKEIENYVKIKKIPVIVDWFSGDDGHYSVVVDIDKKFIYLQDPELGRVRKMDRRTFQRVWFDFEPNYLKSPNDIIIRRLIALHL